MTYNKAPLYALDSQGGIKYWEVGVIQHLDNSATLRVKSGKYKGKLTTKDKHITTGKNIGKANETTPYEQAVSEADSKWKAKIDKDYRESIEEAKVNESIRPMLAHKYDDKKHLIEWPWLAQPKLDGVRCIITRLEDDNFTFTSRGGKSYDVLYNHTQLQIDLIESMEIGDVWDGEIYKHGWSLQRIIAAVKKYNPIDTERLEFWRYDIINENTFENRYKIEDSDPGIFIKQVDIYTVENEAELKRLHDKFVQEDYEGLILRNPQGLYKKGNRSADLLKYKAFQEEEFEIIGTGVETQKINSDSYNCIMFKCRTEMGAEFSCRIKGTLIDRQEMLKEADSYIGKQLTVRFFTYTDDTVGSGKKVPQFPVGITIRDYDT